MNIAINDRGFLKLRFKKLDEDTAECCVNHEHTITRHWDWKRYGGLGWEFRCSCGWQKAVHGRSNHPAAGHAMTVLGIKVLSTHFQLPEGSTLVATSPDGRTRAYINSK